MKFTYCMVALASLATTSACAAQDVPVEVAPAPPAPVVYTNMEEVYFDGDAGRDAAPWLGLEFTGEEMRAVDAYGVAAALPEGLEVVSRSADRMSVSFGGRTTELRRARPVSCWGVVRKGEKPDGSPDWEGGAGLALHDQGGRVLIGGGDTGAPPTILRIRRVTWPEGSSSRPSLVLYVHTPDKPDTAVSYSWADIDAKFVGINLRWMQASCSIES